MRERNQRAIICLITAAIALSGCSDKYNLLRSDNDNQTHYNTILQGSSPELSSTTGQEERVTTPAESGTIDDGEKKSQLSVSKFPGKNPLTASAKSKVSSLKIVGDGLLLNFENADLRDVVRIILGDYLQANYIYDPAITGSVSLQTTTELPAKDVLATLETLLRMNGAALLVEGDNNYRVVPAAGAVHGNLVPQLGLSKQPLPLGYSVHLFPLKFIAAEQMEQLLTPFVASSDILRVDPDRNLLLIAGTSSEIRKIDDMVQMFDVDWLRGKSVGLFRLDFVDPTVITEELNTLFSNANGGMMEKMITFTPLNRLNALLVVAHNAAYLDQVERWVNRLDHGKEIGQNLYVYYLQNGKAGDIAKILTEIFSKRAKEGTTSGRVAPGRKVVNLASPASVLKATANKAPTPATRKSEGLEFSKSADIRIIADEVNNALLILASSQDYRMVNSALKKLDIVPLQVLIEATIAEVTLTDSLRYGVQWFFKNGGFGTGGEYTGTLNSSNTGNLASTFPGFSFVVNQATGGPRFILDMLEKETEINIVSSPHLMVLDNQTAELSVGQEVPVITQQQQSSVSSSSALINTIQYKNTGVIMKVTPRVNTGGSIIMEIEQEVSNVVPSAEATLTPTISKRNFKSSVVVMSGDTVVLGGLISDFKTKSESGVPFLSQLPIIGALFGSTENNEERTELLMMISPRVIRNREEATGVTAEIRRRLKSLEQLQMVPPETLPSNINL
ncbi:MAG: type II secretion system secretin GspD [Candidatus Polarisedimenticolaceae bacterium]|nr:type II secretion system secretin GspD [Candidatus Polarisedimenticolaceae bacterium]